MKNDIKKIYTKAIDAVSPYIAVKNVLNVTNKSIILTTDNKIIQEYSLDSFKNIFVVGAGKATAPMAKAIEELFENKISGTIIVKYGYTENLKYLKCIEASHPIPDNAGMNGAKEISNILKNATKDDLVISLISGGGSALMPLPPEEINLNEKQQITDILIKCGATIHEINCIRKHLSGLKGGHAARLAYPATVINLMISDVVGDDLDVIASGPFVADSTTFDDAEQIIKKYELQSQLPQSILKYIKDGKNKQHQDTPKTDDKCFAKTTNLVIASNIIALKAACKEAKELGYNTEILSSMIEGEAKDVALMHAAIAKEILLSGNPLTTPACILSGGEATVTINGTGLGGRNMEFAMHAVKFIDGIKNITIASVGTDGGDGPTDAAGAVVDNETLNQCIINNLNIEEYIKNNDSYHLFDKINCLIKTGPTNTNVMDIRILLIK